jgi:hypothetical protein
MNFCNYMHNKFFWKYYFLLVIFIYQIYLNNYITALKIRKINNVYEIC